MGGKFVSEKKLKRRRKERMLKKMKLGKRARPCRRGKKAGAYIINKKKKKGRRVVEGKRGKGLFFLKCKTFCGERGGRGPQ